MIAGYLSALINPQYRRYRILIAIAPAALVGTVKELGDYLQVGFLQAGSPPEHVRPDSQCTAARITLLVQWWPGAASIKDAVADTLGIASALSALIALEACHCLPGPRRNPPEPL